MSGLGWLALLGCAMDTAPAARPNTVVIVSIDTLRADYLGSYGHRFVQSPTLDALADHGVRFDAVTTAANTTLASHASLMTGTWPHTHGVPRNGFVVSAGNATLAEAAHEAGWATAAFVGAYPLARHFGLDQGFEVYEQGAVGLKLQVRNDRAQRSADEVVDDVLRWMDAAELSDKPLLLFVHLFDVHAPYTPPAPFDRLYRRDSEPMDGTREHLDRISRELQAGTAKASELEIAKRAYAGGVTWVDAQVGRLFDGLERRGRWEGALVSVTADHGESFFEHREVFDHGFHVYEEVVHVPWILRLPGDALAGSVVDVPVSSVDVMPTLLKAMEVPVPEAVEGRSRWPEVRGRSYWFSPPPVYAEATKPHSLDQTSGWRNALKMRAVRRGDAKYVYRPTDGAGEHYLLSEDPAEQHALAEDEELASLLESWHRSADPLPSEPRAGARSSALLKALGYLDDDPEEEAADTEEGGQ